MSRHDLGAKDIFKRTVYGQRSHTYWKLPRVFGRRDLLGPQNDPGLWKIGALDPAVVSQSLPPELLLSVFQYLTPPTYYAAFTYSTQRYQTFYYRDNDLDDIHEQQLSLVWATQCCRAWHEAGTELLYFRPFLTSLRCIRLFARTLRLSPMLACLVNEVFVMEHDSRSPHEYRRIKNITSRRRDRREGRRARSEIIECLGCCSSLKALTITLHNRNRIGTLPIDKFFVRGSSIGDRICHLTVHGSCVSSSSLENPVISSDISLPRLETLCLREVGFAYGIDLPSVPNLHTLQIAQCYSHSFEVLTIPSEKFPALSTLELYENSIRIILNKKSIHQLKRLHRVGQYESLGHSDWITPSMHSLRHLTIGYGLRDDLLPLALPQTLETLTVLFRVERYYSQPVIDNLGILSSIHERLTVDQDMSLKELSIMMQAHNGLRELDQADLMLQKLRDICLVRSVHFCVETQDFDNWFTERLHGSWKSS